MTNGIARACGRAVRTSGVVMEGEEEGELVKVKDEIWRPLPTMPGFSELH